jgi:hypothetical protein
MEHQFKSIVVNLGGVLLPPFHRLVFSGAQNRLTVMLQPSQRNEIRDLLEAVQVGRMSLDEMLERTGIRDLGITAEEQLISACSNHFQIDAEVVELLGRLSHTRNVYLLQDYPTMWLSQLMKMSGLNAIFTPFDRIFLESSGLKRLIPDLIAFVLSSTGNSKGDVLLIDRRSEVTSACVRSDLNAILFANSFRLEQELNLRQLL